MTDNPKITNIKDVRSRATADKKNNRSGASAGYEKALRKQSGKKGGLPGFSGQVRWYHYIQLFAMLFLVAWLMRACTIGA